MPVCYHCGEKSADTYMCVSCGQHYCVLHTDPITHECNLVIESFSFQTDISRLQTSGLNLFKDSELQNPCTPQGITKPPNESGQFIDFLREEGWLELDRLIIDNSVNDIIQSQINFGLDDEYVEFIKSNYRGFDVSSVIDRFRHHPLVEDLGIWLSEHQNTGSKYALNAQNFSGTFRDLLISHYLHLKDGSYLGEIVGMEPQTGNVVSTEINDKGTVNVSRRLLTYISEHARQSSERECTGLLIGNRDSAGSIDELSGYFPLRFGTATTGKIKSEDFTKLINHIGGVERRLVGWYHSHPKTAVPVYSTADKVTHISLSSGYSIFSFLKQYNKKVPDDKLYNMAMLLGQFSKDQVEDILRLFSKALPKTGYFYYIGEFLNDYLLECYQKHGYDPFTQTSGNPITMENYLGMLKTIKSDFLVLKQKLRRLYKRFNVEDVNIDFKILSFVGLIICPSLRYVVVLECSKDGTNNRLDDLGYDCRYYRIRLIV